MKGLDFVGLLLFFDMLSELKVFQADVDRTFQVQIFLVLIFALVLKTGHNLLRTYRILIERGETRHPLGNLSISVLDLIFIELEGCDGISLVQILSRSLVMLIQNHWGKRYKLLHVRQELLRLY